MTLGNGVRGGGSCGVRFIGYFGDGDSRIRSGGIRGIRCCYGNSLI